MLQCRFALSRAGTNTRFIPAPPLPLVLHAVPDSIASLSRLVSLDLSRNELRGLPDGMCSLTGLTRLDLSSNSLHGLPNGPWQLERLVELRVRRCACSYLLWVLGVCAY
jgi:hypothetical protein